MIQQNCIPKSVPKPLAVLAGDIADDIVGASAAVASEFTTTLCICFGYTCSCGERVTVLRLRSGTEYELPLRKVVACRNGHPAVYSASQFGSPDSWTEEAEEGAA
jgi:hypothetical protein